MPLFSSSGKKGVRRLDDGPVHVILRSFMDIINKTNKPLRIPLPGGKKLFLGPGKTGQVTAKALQHPPLVKLIEAGDVESDGATTTRQRGGADKAGHAAGLRHGATGAMRQSGDR